MARTSRITGTGESFYHITSRIVDKVYRFTPEENDLNVPLLRRVEAFSGVQVISFCFMSDHMHILLRVPGDTEKEITDTVLLQRIESLYGKKQRNRLQHRWTVPSGVEPSPRIEKEKDAYRHRMNDLGEFMKTLKQRLTQSYNKRHDREGTLWESRYHSILLEPTQHVLSVVSAYIDLNPVRAHMVSDTSTYCYSSFGEACEGKTLAQEGLRRIYKTSRETPSWQEIEQTYRALLLNKEPSILMSISSPTIQDAFNTQSPLRELLENKVRMFTRGVALGCDRFIQHIKHFAKTGIFNIPPPS